MMPDFDFITEPVEQIIEPPTCHNCGTILHTAKEIENEECYTCSGWFDYDYGDPAEANMDEKMLMNIGMGD